MNVFFPSILKLALFISLLDASVASEIADFKVAHEKRNLKYDDANFSLKVLGPQIIPILLGHYFQQIETNIMFGNLYLSSIKRKNGEGNPFIFVSYETNIIQRCFHKKALPYAVEAYCNIKTCSPYDLGRMVALNFLFFVCSEEKIQPCSPFLSLEKKGEELRKKLNEHFQEYRMEPLLPNKKNIDYISRFLGIPQNQLSEIFGVVEIPKE